MTESAAASPAIRLPRVVVLRGHQATPWELGPWLELGSEFDVVLAQTRRNGWDLERLPLSTTPARTFTELLPARAGMLAERFVGDRYRGLSELLLNADIVHSEELSYWFAADAARLKLAGGRFRLVQTA